MTRQNFFVSGGAGFIGSTLCSALLERPSTNQVVVYDNFSSGRKWHLEHHEHDKRLKVVIANIEDFSTLTNSMQGIDCVFHLASNPDISKAATDPDIDFRQGTILTRNIVEAARLNGISKIVYTSGSGVYGDQGENILSEASSTAVPVSTYAASKIAGESLLCAYAHMFDLSVSVLRFANVVGAHQTHGVGFDFVKKLLNNPTALTILGDGCQTKSYIHVEDVVQAMLLAMNIMDTYKVFNVSTDDFISVNQIAVLAVETMKLDLSKVEFIYTGGPVGWKGDVPQMRMNSDSIKKIGWCTHFNSNEAISASLAGIHKHALAGRL